MWSVIDLLEKLVNGFPLFGGSTFEQVEDEAQVAPGCMVCARQGYKVLVAASSAASSLSLLVQGTEPRGPLALCPSRREEEVQDQPPGPLLPSTRQEGSGVDGN